MDNAELNAIRAELRSLRSELAEVTKTVVTVSDQVGKVADATANLALESAKQDVATKKLLEVMELQELARQQMKDHIVRLEKGLADLQVDQ